MGGGWGQGMGQAGLPSVEAGTFSSPHLPCFASMPGFSPTMPSALSCHFWDTLTQETEGMQASAVPPSTLKASQLVLHTSKMDQTCASMPCVVWWCHCLGGTDIAFACTCPLLPSSSFLYTCHLPPPPPPPALLPNLVASFSSPIYPFCLACAPPCLG